MKPLRFLHAGPWFAAALCVLMLIGILWLQWADARRPELPPLELRLEARAPQNLNGRLIMDGHAMIQFQLPASASFAQISLPLATGNEPISSIRIDPLSQPGSFEFRHLRIVRGDDVLQEIGRDHLESLNPGSTLRDLDTGWRVDFTSSADYPAIALRDIYPLNTPMFSSRPFLRTTLFWSWLAGGIALLAILSCLVRFCIRTGQNGTALAAGTFLTIFGMRLITLDFFGDRVPHWDYWSLPWSTYLPYLDGNLTWQAMIAPVNEHRILLTRIFSLGLFVLNGIWDNLYEAAAMSLFHALTGTGLALVLWRATGRTRARFIFPLVILAVGLPFSWENTVWANQSQFYFFLGFSLLSFWLVTGHRALSARWWLGGCAMLATQFTIGSGFIIPLVIVALIAYRTLREPSSWRDGVITIAFALFLFGFALLLRVDSAAGGMRTENLDQFIQTFGRTMSWPYIESLWLWIFLWSPWFLFIGTCLLRKQAWSQAESWITILGGWGLVNALGVGIYRGAFSQGPLSRYMDITALPLIAAGLALTLLVPRDKAPARLRIGYKLYSYLWVALVLAGAFRITNYELNHAARSRLAHQERSRQSIRHFMETDDLRTFLSKREYELPHPNALHIATLLRTPAMQQILPPAIRNPLSIEPDSMTGFTSPGVYFAYDFQMTEPTWGSYGREGDRTTGTFASRRIAAPATRYLEFPVLSRTSDGQDTVGLRVVSESGARHRVTSRRDSTDWTPAHVRVPPSPFTVEAFDYDERFWIAFRSPREISTASVWARRLIRSGPTLAALGLLLLAAAACHPHRQSACLFSANL